MNLDKDRSTVVNGVTVTLQGDGSTMPNLVFEDREFYVTGSDLIALGMKLQKWGKKLVKASGD
jgi:hypothetical protein